VSRVPVCLSCLQEPKPLQTEFFCRGCRTAFVSSFSLDEKGFCAVCRENLTNFDAAYSFGAYEGSLRKLIHLFKYGKVESLAEPLSRFLLLAIPLEAQFDVVIAMPMHWRKQWERGFNQAKLLAEPIAKRYGLKVAGSLRRTRYTKAQAGLSEAQRRDNLKNSFQVERRDQVAGKRVLLIDDVFTTGATLRAAVEVLKAAGASHVTALTLARVDHHSPETGRRSLEALRLKNDFAPTRENAEVEVSAGPGVQ
jgi:ComF family protein